VSGVGVYSQEILARLTVSHPGPRYLFCYRPHRYLKAPPPHRALLTQHWPRRLDIFHSLNQRVETTQARRVVSTFHDLFVLTGEYSTSDFRARFASQARQAGERSDLIIAVSEFTASQVETLLQIPRARIRVIHHGVRPAPPLAPAIRGKSILFVGALQKRKNIARLVQAFEGTPPGWKLILVGSTGFGAEEILAQIEHSPRRADIELPGYVSTASLERYYAEAAIFAFPSLDEGFGMPVLDAMVRGLPVLTSTNSALAEVAAGAAMQVDARDGGAIQEGLNTLIANEDLRVALSAQGLRRSASFSWQTAVDRTWDVYNELLG
jgi:glycosyltransferase involved in cell wall biosynthesis